MCKTDKWHKAPKQAKQLKKIIDDWLVENEGKYQELRTNLWDKNR